ncbi:MAG: hypothetical protein IJ715_01525, partial [Bacilli bacterium]|nr:hypothetical protein [Bacilli bacterium]
PLTIYAKDFKIEDISIDLDDSWYVFTKDNIKNNQDLKLLGVSEEYMNDVFDGTDYYLDAIKFNNDEIVELFIIIKDTSSLYDSSDFTDEQIEELRSSYEKQISNSKTTIFTTDSTKYIKSIYKDQDLNIVDYYAVINKKGYTFKIQKNEEFSEEELNELDKMIENIIVSDKDNNVNEDDIQPLIDNKKGGNSVLTGTIIGAIIGGIIGLIGYIIKKK